MLPFDQLEVLGTYVSPVALVMLLCGAVWLLLRQVADALGLLPLIWHPALFFTALYVILVSVAGLWISHAAAAWVPP